MTASEVEKTIEAALLRVVDNVAKHCVQRGGFDDDDKCLRFDLRESQAEIAAAITAAVAAEREACASLVDGWHISKGGYTEMAHQIRERGNAPSTR